MIQWAKCTVLTLTLFYSLFSLNVRRQWVVLEDFGRQVAIRLFGRCFLQICQYSGTFCLVLLSPTYQRTGKERYMDSVVSLISLSPRLSSSLSMFSQLLTGRNNCEKAIRAAQCSTQFVWCFLLSFPLFSIHCITRGKRGKGENQCQVIDGHTMRRRRRRRRMQAGSRKHPT